MANTVYGPYTATAWSGTTGINITRLDNLETAANVALYGLNPQLSGPFVHSGITCTKDGVTANQLDIASGYAFVTMSDGTTGFIVVAADNTYTTSALSSTYHLYLQPDGTWYWNTANSPAANSLHICDVATDGSGNISTVTDQRHTNGNPGLVLVGARAIRQHITVTTQQTLITYTVPVTGFYRLSGYFTLLNAGNSSITFKFHFTDPDDGRGDRGTFFYTDDPTHEALNAHATPQSAYSVMDYTLAALAGTTITVYYQDTTGTPNDYVSAAIERLA